MEKLLTLVLAASVSAAFALDAGPARKRSGTAPNVSAELLKRMSGKLHKPGKALRKPAAAPSRLGAVPAARLANARRPLELARGTAAAAPASRILRDEAYGTPTFLDGRDLRRPPAALKKGAAWPSPKARAMAYLEANREIFKLDAPGRELEAVKEHTDQLGKRHVIFRQLHEGVPVWGHELSVHMDSDGAMYGFNARYAPTRRLWSARGASLTPAEAITIATKDLAAFAPPQPMSERQKALLGYAGPTAEKYVWMDARREPRLVWHVAVRPGFRDHWQYFVDARTGAVLEKYNATAADGPATATAADAMGVSRSIHTYQVGSSWFLIDGSRKGFKPAGLPGDPVGALWTLDARNKDLGSGDVFNVMSSNNAWSDPVAVSAHYNTSRVYEYYLNTFGRLGIDGAGSTLIAVVHVTDEGQKMENAYWNGKAMAYGDGGGAFKPLARALDVAAHEMTHGIISSTVNLEYKFQSGALNESLADFFGAMVDREDWLLAEDCVNAGAFPSGAMRDMQDPHNGGRGPGDHYWQPAHMNEFREMALNNDNGGVHVNSGIPNKAAYLIATAIGREKTEKIYYRIMDAHYLNKTSQFVDMRVAAIRAATDLHGENSPEVAAVKNGFAGVGIGAAAGGGGQETPTPRPQDVPAVEGSQFVALVNAEGGDNSLYLAKPVVQSDADIQQISTTQVYTETGNPLAIPDDGSAILFIDKLNALRGIDEAGEQIVDHTIKWRSIAISPDGTKVAATTVELEPKIYILDLVDTDASKIINLYTPTTGSDVKVQTVKYADALDFNSTGEMLLYDAFNSVPQGTGLPGGLGKAAAGGSAIEYWDVNLIDLKTEIITPFFPSMPEGINMGNPSFAQTSDLNIVFDVFNANTSLYAVIATDLFTGAAEVIDSAMTGPGFPRFSTDDRRIVYERPNGIVLEIRQRAVAADKVTPSGAPIEYITGGQKPSWYAVGKRPPAGFPFPRRFKAAYSLNLEPSPLARGQALRYVLPAAADVDLAVYDLFGRKLASLDRGRKGPGEHRIRWEGLNGMGTPAARGMYFFRFTAKGVDGSKSAITKRKAVSG